MPSDQNEAALSPYTVLDLTRVRSGPTCVKQLADWGANVIKIEEPGGDDKGAAGGPRGGPDFQNLHRNKRSLTLDLSGERGRAVFHRLARDADIVVENMRPPVKYRLGVDYETLSALNPRLIYGSISGFGQDGPYGDRGGVDQIAQGLGGLMSVTGQPGGGPLRVGVPIADLAAGVYLAMGLLAAVHERERSGKGQWVQTSLLEAMVAMLDFQAARYTLAGEVPGQEGNHHPTNVPMGCFRTADGWVNIAGPSGRLYRRFCEVTGLEALLDDERFATGALRSQHRSELNAIIEERLATASTEHWVEALNAAGVPAGPVNAIDETMKDPQVRHLGLAQPVEHHELGTVELIRNPVGMSRTPHRFHRPSPDPGEHRAEILADAGFTPEEIAALVDDGVI